MKNETKRTELFNKHKIYLEILDVLGHGIMLKPQLEVYILRFKKYKKSRFDKVVKDLADAHLIEVERTNSASIILLRKPGIALLRGKDINKVSRANIRTQANLRKSIMVNEFILNKYKEIESLEQLLEVLSETNLLARNGDNVAICRRILETSLVSNKEPLERELAYIEAVHQNKLAQLKSSNSTKTKLEKGDLVYTLNNLQARGIYVLEAGETFKVVYMEICKVITYKKLKEDMSVLSRYLQNVMPKRIEVHIVAESNRIEAIKSIVNHWRNKGFSDYRLAPNDLKFKSYRLKIKEKYLKRADISI